MTDETRYKALWSGAWVGLTLLSACAHSYYYRPEISGDGAIFRKGSIAFRIPSKDPRMKMKIDCLGITEVPRGAGPKKQGKQVQFRMYFLRVNPCPNTPTEFIDPSEQGLSLMGGSEIRLGLIHSAAEHTDRLIRLSPSQKQIVDLYFPLPGASRGARDLQFLNLHWTVHIDSATAESQSTRFDRQDSRPQQGAELYPADNDFPLDYSPIPTPGWTIDPWPWWWWEPFPLTPWVQ